MPGILGALSLVGSAFQTIGDIYTLEDQRQLSLFNRKETKKQAQASSELFNQFTLPTLEKQQAQRRGYQVTQFAKAGVDTGSGGSVLAFMSEQARQDQREINVARWQQQLEQRNYRVQADLAKRDARIARVNQVLTGVGGAFRGAGAYQAGGGG